MEHYTNRSTGVTPEEEYSTGQSPCALCDHLFGLKCSGEVVNLIRAAERYGFLMERARARIEFLCFRCRKGLSLDVSPRNDVLSPSPGP